MPQSDELDRHLEFLRLFAAHEAAVRVFLRAILPSRNDADEAFQLTMITLWEKFEEYDSSRDFKPWAFGIAKYKALGLLRDRQRERLVFGDVLADRLAEDAIAAEDRYLTQQEALDGCLRKLSAPLRETVLQAYTKGTRIDELAKSLGQTPMALYKKLQRIRRTLLDCVRQALEEAR
jgi:RNA polymerase sigma-70 factor, ECF subfamily